MREPVILLVDDEPELRALAALVLQRANCKVLVAGDAARALQVSRSATRIDLVITDVQMGDGATTGVELAAALRAERPGLPAVIMSGTPGAEALAAQRGFAFLKKPFTLKALAATALENLAVGGGIRRRSA